MNIKIQDLFAEDRPREKLLAKGAGSLTNAELLGIVIGSGNSTTSAVLLAQIILKKYNNDLNALSRCSVKDFQKFKGIGEVKAIVLVSVLELSRRRSKYISPVLNDSESIFKLMQADLSDKTTEEFWIVLLNNSNKLIKTHLISHGGITNTSVDLRIIFKIALENTATAIVLVHNHPSGNLNPSTKDIDLTKQIIEGSKILDIKVLDHIIIAENKYFSFADENLIFTDNRKD